jgi:hypothetical protein
MAAVQLFAQALNRVFAAQGVVMQYTPRLQKAELQSATPIPGGCERNTHELSLEAAVGIPACQNHAGTNVCRCQYIPDMAMDLVCEELAERCGMGDYQTALYLERGKAVQWLIYPTYDQYYNPTPGTDCRILCANFCTNSQSTPTSEELEAIRECGCTCGGQPDDTPASPATPEEGGSTADDDTTPTPGSTPDQGAPSQEPPICIGSPLVLDLGRDGIHPISRERGVSFDLFGLGKVRTAWIRGDDALLVLDRNANGVIDDGTELFGESKGLDGTRARNGFAALSQIDALENGGNHNGRIDPADALFPRLRLWRDANQDGISQPEELVSLANAGVRTLSLAASYTAGQVDPYGNDLGLQGSFTRKDGTTGLMIDVYFAFSGERKDLLVTNSIEQPR